MARILAGIILYNTEINRLLLEINSIYNQVDAVCILDNGSSNWKDVYKKIIELHLSNLIVLEEKSNLGIGGATNKIFAKAEKEGFEWVLTLDHDTICPDNMIKKYKTYLNCPRVGVICPSVVDPNVAINTWKGSAEYEIEKVDRCIQSGALVSVESWKKAKGFDEWMFIDFVDFDFCMRMKVCRYDVIRCNSVCIDHQLGNRVQTKMASLFNGLASYTELDVFKYFTYVNVFSPSRVYYTTRNNIVYIYKYKEYINTRKEWMDFGGRIIKRILRSKHKAMIVRETIHGIKDAVKYLGEEDDFENKT